jgi:hypothetical protein
MESPISIIGFAFRNRVQTLDFLTTPPRYSGYTRPRYKAHPQDCSVMTYKGHCILQTLIRCHFSPAETTGAQYLYSGSADGRIHVCRWSMLLRTFPLNHIIYTDMVIRWQSGSRTGPIKDASIHV